MGSPLPWPLRHLPCLFSSGQLQKVVERGLFCCQVAFGSHLISSGWTVTPGQPSLLGAQAGAPTVAHSGAVVTFPLLSGHPHSFGKTHHSLPPEIPEVWGGVWGRQVKGLEQKEEPRGSSRESCQHGAAVSSCSCVQCFHGGEEETRRETHSAPGKEVLPSKELPVLHTPSETKRTPIL